MNLEQKVGGRDRLIRAVLAVVLTVATVRTFRNGKKTIGLLAGVGAIGFGFNATTCFCGLNETLGIDMTDN